MVNNRWTREDLKRLIEQSVNDSKFQIRTNEVSSREVDFLIDTEQPTPERPNKRSNILIFRFSYEFIRDFPLDHLDVIAQNIRQAFNTFNFNNQTPRYETQPTVRFVIDETGNIRRLDNS